jgi:DNA-binding MarR family transcriptional regulator
VALPNATGIVGRLSDRGLVERGTDPTDRRIVRVSLSRAGRALLAGMEAQRLNRLRRLVSTMDAPQQRRFLRSVSDLVEAIGRLETSTETP